MKITPGLLREAPAHRFGCCPADRLQHSRGFACAVHRRLVEAVNEATAQLGASRVGIYSSSYGWSVAMGGYSDLANLPLWYAHCA